MELWPATRLQTLARAVLRAAGCDENEAGIVARHLIEANLAGHDSHGIGMLPSYIRLVHEGLAVPNQTPDFLVDRGAIIVVDAKRGFGQTMARTAILRGCERAKAQGAAVVALRNSSHVGRIGAYAELCADQDLASTHFVNVVDHSPVVAPYGGSDGRFITNPFSAAMPVEGRAHPLLDMATSTIALGKARVARNKGVEVPEGALLDEDGRPTRDPTALIDDHKGALTAFGAHKGSGLAVMCELFAGALTGGVTMQPGNPRRGGIVNNMLSIILDPAAFAEADQVTHETQAFVDWVKQSPPAPGFDEVLVPGEPEERARAERAADGVPVDPKTLGEILDAGASLGLDRASLEADLRGEGA